jgi:hypothetical protein
MECDENKYTNLINYVDNPEEYPHEKLHCHNVTDQIWLGAVDDTAINDNTHEVASDQNNDFYWPKNKNSQFEPVRFQVKLYGPFKYPYARTPSDGNKAGWAGEHNPQLGNSVTIVPKDTDGKAVETAQNIYGQPVAESCVISTQHVGPNWNDPETTLYDAVFTQDTSSCDGNGVPGSNSIKLTPGFYVSVVEIVRDEIKDTNAKFAEVEENEWGCIDAAGNPKSDSYSASSNKCASQIMTRPHNMFIEDRFTSAWGDKRETLLVPVPLYIITRRDDSAQETFEDQATINDQYWVAGFSGEYVVKDGEKYTKHRWTDIWGSELPLYGTYNGEAGYVMNGSLPGN